jgi:hypothetical protein
MATTKRKVKSAAKTKKPTKLIRKKTSSSKTKKKTTKSRF